MNSSDRRRISDDAQAACEAARVVVAEGAARRTERMEAEAEQVEARLIREHRLAVAEERLAQEG
jgi:hypothetical protein